MQKLLSTQKSISELIDDFKSGRIAVPEIQRDVVWNSDQVKKLLDSISKGFPCGSLILWEPREKDKKIVETIVRPERKGNLPKYFILDGQQRLTALSSVMLKRELLKKLLAELDEELPYIYINLNKLSKEKEMESSDTPTGYKFPWVLHNTLFDDTFFSNPDYIKMTIEKKDMIRNYCQEIRSYQFPVQIISEQGYPAVAEIFTRVNSQGTELTGAEINMAKIVPHWPGVTKKFRDYRYELTKSSYDLQLNFLMRAITAIECGVPQIKKLSEKISKGELKKNHLNKTWNRVMTSTNGIIKVLQNDLLLDKSKFITSMNSLIPLVSYRAREKRGLAKRDIKKFFLLSQLSEHYGSSSETRLRNDFRTLNEASTPRQGLAALVEEVDRESRQEYRALKIKSEVIYGSPSRNVVLLLMYLLMKKNSATDWGAGPCGSLADIEPAQTQLHHIFPLNFISEDKVAIKRYLDGGLSEKIFRAHVHSLANLTFLSQEKNASIGDIPPSQYLPNETSREKRRAHFIPEDPKLWKPENFMDFLEERSNLIATAMSRFLKGL